MRHKLLPIFLVATLVASCAPPREDLDFISPRITSIEPASGVIPVDAVFTVRFSEPISAATVTSENIVLVEREKLTPEFLADLANGLNQSRQDDIVPAEVVLTDETTLTLTPNAPLDAGTQLTLAIAGVRDLVGNPVAVPQGAVAFLYHVETDDGPPNIIDHDVDNGVLLARNRERFTVVFDQPVLGLTRDNLRVTGPGAPAAEGIEITPDRLSATLILEDNPAGCERFAGNTEYAVEVGPGVTDDDGNEAPAVSLPFTTGPVCDETPVRILAGPLATAGEVNATITWTTDEPSSTEVRFGLFGGALDCLGQPCPLLGPPSLSGSGSFPHAVELSGLDVDQLFIFEIRSVDLEGFATVAAGEFLTAELPDIAINEFLAAGAGNDDLSEFIELANYGDTPIDISGWSIRLDEAECVLPENLAPVESGGYRVIGHPDNENTPEDDGFDEAAAGVPETLVIEALCRSLTNTSAQVIVLADPDGRPVSSYSAHRTPPSDGISLERVAPDAADAAENWCRSPGGGTPGAQNDALVSGVCD